MDPGAAVTEVFGRDMQRLAAYFYADDGILPSTWVTCLQRNVYTLTELLDRVVLCTNVDNMVIRACLPYHVLGGHSAEAYVLQMIG